MSSHQGPRARSQAEYPEFTCYLSPDSINTMVIPTPSYGKLNPLLYQHLDNTWDEEVTRASMKKEATLNICKGLQKQTWLKRAGSSP